MQSDPPSARRRLHFALLAAKIALSAGLIWYAFGKVDLSDAWHRIAGASIHSLVIVALLLFLQMVATALRLHQILTLVGRTYPLLRALDVAFIGAFFSQAFISFVGGDAMRIWRIARSGVSVDLAARAVVLDRVAGVAGLIALLLLMLPGMFVVITDSSMRLGLLVALCLGVAGFAALALLQHLPHGLTRLAPMQWLVRLSLTAASLARERKNLAGLLGLSIAIQLLNVCIFYVIAAGLSIDLKLLDCLILVPPILFISMLPISFAGWGVRESAAIAAFSLVGAPQGAIVTVSVLFGLAVFAISLPGAVLWLLQRNRNGMSPEEVESRTETRMSDKPLPGDAPR